MAVLVTHLLFAQVTLVCAACAVITGRISRWRPLWLAVPAAAGAAWVAAIGVTRAVAGFAAGPRQVADYLAGTPGHPGRLLHLADAFAGAGHWLPRQLPLALVAAAAEAAVLSRLSAGQGDRADYRAGLVVAIRRRLTEAALSAGGVVTRDGCGLGLDGASGRRAEVSWAEAGGGVLAICADPQAAARASFPLACAAVRRRKTVIVIDLTGSAWLAEALTAVCAAAGAPLSRFSSAGPGCYEPFRSHPPARAASLVAQMIDWTGTTARQRQASQRYLADALAVLAASPAPAVRALTPAAPDLAPAGADLAPAGAVLDGLIALLEPAALRDAMSGVPGYLPQREALARRVAASSAALEAEPAAATAIGGQLRRLRASAPGRWLRAPATAPPGAAGPPAAVSQAAGAGQVAGAGQPVSVEQAVSVGQAVRERGVVLFSLDRGVHAGAAAMVGRLAVADLAAVLRGLRELHLRGDCLAWIHGGEVVHRQSLAGLLEAGPATGTAVVFSTASATAAASLAPAARLVMTGGATDRALAARLAELAAFRGEGSQHARAELLRWQDEDEFAVIARGPRPRFQPGCRSVPGPWAGLG